MMKYSFAAAALAGLAAGLAFVANPAAAADPIRKGPHLVDPPIFSWTGFYAGINAGAAWDPVTTTYFASTPMGDFCCALPGTLSASVSGALAANGSIPSDGNGGGFMGGAQFGYNWQFSPSFLIGAETDFQGIVGSSNSGYFPSGFLAPQAPLLTEFEGTKYLDYFGTVRGRLGWLPFPELLVYGTGGLAYGGVQSSASIAQYNDDLGSTGWATGVRSTVRLGWTAGGGVEWMFMPQVSLKAEYLYYDLGTVAYQTNPLWGVTEDGSVAYATSPFVRTRHDGHIVRVGVNYHFADLLNGVIAAPAAVASPNADDDEEEETGPARWLEVESGTEATTRARWFQHFETTAAVGGNLEESGFRSRMSFGFGQYNYPVPGVDAVPPWTWSVDGFPWLREFTKVYGKETAASVLGGYQFVTDRWEFMGLLGVDVLTHNLSVPDPTNGVKGTRVGLKVALQVDALPTDKTLLYGYGSYSTAFQTADMDLKAGYKVMPRISIADFVVSNIYVGPHWGFYADAFERIWKTGAHVTATDIGPYHASLAAGYSHDRYLGPGAYGQLEVSRRF